MSTQKLWKTRTENLDDGAQQAQTILRRVDSKRRSVAIATVVFCAVCLAASALAQNDFDRTNANDNQVILRTANAGKAKQVATQYGLKISGKIRSAEGYAALLESPASLTVEQVEDLLSGDPRVLEIDRAQLAALPDTSLIDLDQAGVEPDLSKAGDFTTPCLEQGFSDLVWSGYANQQAIQEIRLHEAQAGNGGDCGSAIVAIIDNGVDPDHPLLERALIPGYDYILDKAGIPDESAGLEASVASILDASVASILDASVASILDSARQAVLAGEGELVILDSGSLGPILEASVASILDQQPTHGTEGHGTMIAGEIRLMAPTASIMPLRVFDHSGSAHILDIINAIYFATNNGADVISMSFSMREHSLEMQRAIQYARRNGVVLVASAGNHGNDSRVYPAAYGDVIAVAALDEGQLSSFSNFGSGLVDMAAPGNGIISAFPGGLYGAGWGTSFSAPLVAGAAALLIHRFPTKDTSSLQHIENALRQSAENLDSLNGLIGAGRLDALGAVQEAAQ